MDAPTQAKLPSLGDVVAGKYRLERVIGQGGMGAVYAADHELLGQKVAVKVLLAEVASNAEATARFVNEARAAFRIQSEHVVRVLDVGMHDGSPYMVMEMLEGVDLAQLLEQRGRLEPSEAVSYVLQALRAIGQAHSLGIIHRDLKPSNLFLARKADGGSVVKVLDFGISKAQSGVLGQAPGALTSTKAMLGSPLYMSPEQLRSSKSVDARADVWAMGVVLYELLTGTVPYNGDNIGELFAAILEQDAPPLRARAPQVSPGLEQVVMACLQRRVEARVASVEALASMLEPFASGSVTGQRPAFASHPGLPAHPVSSGAMGAAPPSPGAVHASSSGQAAGVGGMAASPVQTGGPWADTGSRARPARGGAALVAGVVGGVVLIVAAVGGALALRSHRAAAEVDQSVAAEPSSLAAAPPPASTEIVPPAPPAETPAATASAAPDDDKPATIPAAGPKARAAAVAKPDAPARPPAVPNAPAQPASAPPADAPPPRAKPTTPSTLQNAR